MEIVIIVVIIIYFLEHAVFFTGVLRNLKRGTQESYESSVSVIVAAKNEESCIEACINSLLKLNYPSQKLEIILVNDNSTDKTGEIMQGYLKNNPVLKYLETDIKNTKLVGKTRALSQAVSFARGEIIFTTDADIQVQSSWVRDMLKYYDKDTGVVSSYSIIKPNSIFSGIQAFDWIYLLTIASGSFGIGKPISCVGNNMSYKKNAYDEVGGYEKIKFSVTEDFMLLQAIYRLKKWKTKFPVNPFIVNFTNPSISWSELYQQKKRWTKGGLDAKSLGILVGAISWLTGLIMLSGWIFLDMKLYVLFLICKMLIDSLYVFPVLLKFRMLSCYLWLIFFELYYSVYVFLMPFALLFDRKIIWKDKKY